MTSSTSASLSMRRAPQPGLSGMTGCGPMRPSARSSAPIALGKPKCATRSPCRWPISRRPTRKENSPREPCAVVTPGHDVASAVMRSLAVMQRW